MPGPRGGRPMEKPKNVGAAIRRVVKYLAEYKFCICWSSLSLLFSARSPALSVHRT